MFENPESLCGPLRILCAICGLYVNFALNKLDQYVADKNDHSSIMIIGNEATGLWKKAYALASPEELIKIVEGVANDKVEGSK